MKYFIILALGVFLLQLCGGENAKSDDDGERPYQKNITFNGNNVREFPEPPLLELTKNDDWIPWKHPMELLSHVLEDDEEDEIICREDSSMDDFPDDAFSQEQRLQGAIILHFIGVIYFFTLTGMLINYYYLPSVQCICDALNITPDVGAAVFMSTATCTPELFTNLIGTFIADSDMGVGAVVGSLMFNILGVSAVASFATRSPVQMDWAPITRDCVVFAVNVIVLIGTTWDGYIYWYEAMIIMLFAIPYYIIMFQSPRINRFLQRKFEVEYGCCNRLNLGDNETTDVEKKGKDNAGFKNSTVTLDQVSTVTSKVEDEKIDEKALAESERRASEEKAAHQLLKDQRLGLWPPPKDSLPRTIFWYYSWLIRLVLRCTLVNVKKHPKWYPLTFIVSILWIGVNTYLIFFMLIIISYTFSIPESVMGITVFAIGGCTPEIITGFIMARRGNSNVGVSNSVGASSLAIVVALGIPWFFRAVISTPGHEKPYVALHTNGMEYIILSLLLLTLCFYLIVFFRRFILTKITGSLLILTYAVFITLAVLMEVGVFFDLICIPYN